MAGIIRCPNSVLGYKGNGYRGYKWILALPKLKGLIKKIRVKGERRSSIRLSIKRSQLA